MSQEYFSLNIATPDDGSLVVELISSHLRVGFSIEKDINESGWHIVSDDKHGKLLEYGDIEGQDITKIVDYIKERFS